MDVQVLDLKHSNHNQEDKKCQIVNNFKYEDSTKEDD